MRILVTGATGFIGSNLVPYLAGLGHELTGSDHEDANLAVAGQAKALIDAHEPDYVIHLAARYGRLLCRDEPHRAVSDNAAATTELAAACAEHDIGVLYASSSEVYGDHGTDTITEESELRTPTTIYGLSKRWGEEALRLYLPAEYLTIPRFNMIYGPDQRGGYGCCALATFIRDAIEGRALTVHRHATRSWLYIDDAVRAIGLILERPGVWHIGNTHERTSMSDLADLVCEEVGTQSAISYRDPPDNQIANKNYDASKLEALGWEARVPLRQGIARTVAAARQNGIRDYEEDTWPSVTA